MALGMAFVTTAARGQVAAAITTEQIAVSARPSPDSITLRWAPLNYAAWRAANIHGYRVERYTLTRNEVVLSDYEKIILKDIIRPWPEDTWKEIVQRNKYAAIAAQALFGDRFEVDLEQSDVFTIVDKVKENEQRFAFALFSADMSPEVAIASGLWLTDKDVKAGEKYLYRIVINAFDSLRGSAYLGPRDPYTLPAPENLKAEFQQEVVSLKWDKSMVHCYTAYILERSLDGTLFTPVSDEPFVTVSPGDTKDSPYEYAIDSLEDLTQTYHYRVIGITPFGESSPPSATVSGKAVPSVSQVPFITAIENHDNQSLVIHWDFGENDNDAIDGFLIERSNEPNGEFTIINPKTLPPETRSFEDGDPRKVNYYRVIAKGLDSDRYASHLYFAQLIDSIPPLAPTGLDAIVSDSGSVTLTWKVNTENDILGYRIYKAFHRSEELAQVTSEPHTGTTFVDVVNLHTLNEHVYYSVMAIDINQNHSKLSALLKVTLPDKVRPQPPVCLPATNSNEGVSLRWTSSPSEDVVQYAVYRRLHGSGGWKQTGVVKATLDSTYSYRDVTSLPGEMNVYTVTAIDEAGLESEPAAPVNGLNTSESLRPAIAWKRPRVMPEDNKITLTWEYQQGQTELFKIYKATDHQRPVLFKVLQAKANELTDTIVPGKHYSYRIMAVFSDGFQSFLSEELVFQY